MALLRRRALTDADSPTDPGAGTVEVLSRVVDRVSSVQTSADVVREALESVCAGFGWDYGSAWWVGPDDVMFLLADTGNLPERDADALRAATYRKGEGLPGTVWARRELIVIDDPAGLPPGPRASVAVREGLRGAAVFPLFEDGRVVGAMEFVTRSGRGLTRERVMLLRALGTIVSQALDRVIDAERSREHSRDLGAVNHVLRAVMAATNETDSIRVALETIRTEFGWEYGSFWAIEAATQELKFAVESGSAGEEFRTVTREATFKKGVGLAGRTWAKNDLVFEPDMGLVTDCVRAPAAQRAGVRSGVCVPIVVDGQTIGTMDFFTTKNIVLTQAREEAIRNTAFLVSNAIERHRAAGRIRQAGEELMSSITEVERNVLQASNVAADAQRLTDDATQIVASLNASSIEIGNVVKVITSIAEQTNLLALNATIEAARAGDAGKGFAVVANEVKDLARETATATEEVDAKVTAIQTDAQRVVHALDGVTTTVQRINEAQNIISGVLTEQNAVTRSVLEG